MKKLFITKRTKRRRNLYCLTNLEKFGNSDDIDLREKKIKTLMNEPFEKYKGTLQNLFRRAKKECWTISIASFVYLMVGLIVFTVILRVFFFSFGNIFIDFLIFLIEIVALLTPIFFYHRKTVEFVQNECLELESDNPGICEAFDEWNQRFKDTVSN